MQSIYLVWELDGYDKDIYVKDEKTAEKIKNALSVANKRNSYGVEEIKMVEFPFVYAVYRIISHCYTIEIYETEIVDKPVKNSVWDEVGDVGGEICVPLSLFGDSIEEIEEKVIREFKELKEEFLKNK